MENPLQNFLLLPTFLHYVLRNARYILCIFLKRMHDFRGKRRESITTYSKSRRNWIVYHPIPNIFISRRAVRERKREKQEYLYEDKNKNNVDEKHIKKNRQRKNSKS